MSNMEFYYRIKIVSGHCLVIMTLTWEKKKHFNQNISDLFDILYKERTSNVVIYVYNLDLYILLQLEGVIVHK